MKNHFRYQRLSFCTLSSYTDKSFVLRHYATSNIQSQILFNQKAIVDGIVLSIKRAHENLKPSKIYYSEGELHGANINRSPTSYLANPEEERAKYDHDTDHIFAQLNIFDADDNTAR